MQDDGQLILGRYRPLNTAGSGGSGTVKICWDERIQRRVAIKHMPIPHTAAEGESTPGLGEARTAAMLKHPGIVSVIDFEVCGPEALLIMEAVEGPAVSQLIDEAPDNMLELDIVAAVAESVAEVLDFAHENGVLHLDIKPDNILVEPSGAVKVSDFGVSELADATGFGQACGGTIGYMPPEQMLGEDLDQRADAFALAATVYEMLTGERPFAAKTLDGSLRLIEREDFRAVSALRGDVDPQIDEVLHIALAYDRDDRYETVFELMDALAPFLGNPDAGTVQLRALLSDDFEEEGEGPATGGAWNVIPKKARFVLGRLAAGLLSWWVASIGLTAIPAFETYSALGVALIPAALALAVPGLGAALAVAALGGSFIIVNSLSAPVGAILIALAVLWFALVGRKGTAAANCLLATAPLGLAHLAPAAPLLAGFTCTAGRSALTALTQAALALSLGYATGSCTLEFCKLQITSYSLDLAPFALQTMLTLPATWITVASWVICAVLMSAFCSRATRVLSVVGAILCGILFVAAQVGIVYLATGQVAAPGLIVCVSYVLASVIMVVIGCLGAPYRDKGVK